MENKMKSITIRRNLQSTIAIRLEDFYSEKPAREFILTEKRAEAQIPLNYALSIFNTPGVRNLYDDGSFLIVKGKELLTDALEQEQLMSSEEFEEHKVASDDELMEELYKLNEDSVEELMDRYGNRLFDLAASNVDTLPSRSVRLLEEYTHIALTREE